MTFLPGNLYHSGFLVPDLDETIEALRLSGIRRWTAPKEIHGVTAIVKGREVPARFHYSYSCDGPHHLELIEPLDYEIFRQPTKMTFHHFGFWSANFEKDIAEATAAGLPIEIAFIDDASGAKKVTYHKDNVSDIRFELVPQSSQVIWNQRWESVPDSGAQ